MKRKNSINATVTSALLAAVLLPSGCSRGIEPQGNDIETVNFAVGVANCVEVQDDATKAAAATSISSFKVAAFNNSGSDHNQFIAPGTNVNVSGTSATTGIRWTKPYAKVFYAYANLPENGSTVTPAYDGQTLAYTVPATAATQNDVLLAAVETDGGTSHNSAALPFKHPLTQVSFKIGKMENITGVSSITINDVYASGSVKQSSNGSFGTWSHTETQNVSQTPGSPVTPPSSGTTAFGVPFMLIPQSGDITISVTAEKSGEGTKTLTGTISGVNWQAGKATSYTIGFDDSKGLNFTANAVAWGTATAINTPQMETALPDPRYWVDLGMVSSNGKKMYISKYDVKSVSNGVATFETGLTINQISFSDAYSITKSQDGQNCRLLNADEYINLSIPGNFTVTATGTKPNRVFTFTSKMTGLKSDYDHSVKFVEDFYTSVYDGSIDRGAVISYIKDGVDDEYYLYNVFMSLRTSQPVKLVCETDEKAPVVSSLKAYFRGSCYSECPNVCFGSEDQDYTNKRYEHTNESAFIRPVLVYENGFQYSNYSNNSGKYKIICTSGNYTISNPNSGYIDSRGRFPYEEDVRFEISYPGVETIFVTNYTYI